MKADRRKYICMDCGHYRMLTCRMLLRRCKPRCTNCGSTFFVIGSEGAWERAVNAHDQREDIKARRKAESHGGKE